MVDSAIQFLAIFTAVVVGWCTGFYFSRRDSADKQPEFVPTLEFLLSESTDTALQKLLDVQQLDSNTIELFFSLGKSFRKKGEIEKAIQLHQSLFSRADLDRNIVDKVQLELALDYSSAGLLDRAEGLFRDILQRQIELKGNRLSSNHVSSSLFKNVSRHLLSLLEEEQEWAAIVDLYESKRISNDLETRRGIAHAYCQLADIEVNDGNYLETIRLCRCALKADNHCARAFSIQGDLAYRQGELREAIRCYLRSIDIDPDNIIQTLDRLVSAFQQVGDTRTLVHNLNKQWGKTHYVPTLVALVKQLADMEGSETAITQLLTELGKHPSNQAFYAFVDLTVSQNHPVDMQQLRDIRLILKNIIDKEPKFVCGHCGFKAQQLEWRCPSCKQWAGFRGVNISKPAKESKSFL